MPDLRYSSRLVRLFALCVVIIPATLGCAVPQDDISEVSALPLGSSILPVVTGTSTRANVTSTRADRTSTRVIVQATAITAAVPENSAPLQLAPFPARPIFDNSTRFQDKQSYTDPDAPVVISFKNSSDLTSYHIEDKEVFGDLPLSNIPVLFSTAGNVSGSEPTSAGNATSDAVDFAMPRILEQLQVAPEDITPAADEASPILTDALMYLFGQSDIPEQNENDTVSEGTLTKRKFLCCKGISIKKVVDTVTDVVKAIPEAVVDRFSEASYTVTAASTVGGYLATFSQVKLQNPGLGIPVSESHMYFLFQLYGYFPLTAGLKLHFNTRKFLGFISSYDAITFARDIFVVADTKLSPKQGRSDFEFQSMVTTIIHEIRHCQQYRSVGWSVPAFGTKYMYQWCRAGFSYRKLKFEEEAYTQDKTMDDLLYD
ncbi:MAG: hypothetical protein Q9195_004501 [Heterodermia aff. obscurata]